MPVGCTNSAGRTATKTPLLNLREAGLAPDNLEAMELGPRLPNGRPSLLLLSDDNLSATQRTQLLLFALDAGAGATIVGPDDRTLQGIRAARDLGLEFGPAELLDSLLVRPGLMYAFASVVPSAPLAILLGKLAADVVFYVLAIASFEWTRRRSGAT